MTTMKERIARMRGAARQAGAMLSGHPGVLNTLEREHRELSELIRFVLEADAAHSDEVRNELFPTILRELRVHLEAEERELYPALRDEPALGELLDRGLAQHEAIEQLLQRLAGFEQSSLTWKKTFEELAHRLERHVEMEEQQLFPAAMKRLDRPSARELDGRYHAAKKRLLEP